MYKDVMYNYEWQSDSHGPLERPPRGGTGVVGEDKL
jgi:hypothetical protein